MTGVPRLTPLQLEFEGRSRTVPLMSLAMALRVDCTTLASTLRTLTGGVTETLDPGRGGKGGSGERSETTFNEEESGRQRSLPIVTPSTDPDAVAQRLARELHDQENVRALRKLVVTYPAATIDEALRRTQAIPPHKIRRSPAACFTGIVRALARDDWRPT